jgi:hypothetical protein
MQTRIENFSANARTRIAMPTLYIFNTTICTTPGLTYATRIASSAVAREIMARFGGSYISAIGHEATAQVASAILEVSVPANRFAAEMQAGDEALCIKLRGRAPEGVILTRAQMEEIGYDIVHMIVGDPMSTPASPIITPFLLSAALGLALAHGHRWATTYLVHNEALDAAVSAGITAKGLFDAIVALDPNNDGVDFGLSHVTRSGRMSWSIDPETGATTIEVHRPSAAWCRWSDISRGSRFTSEDSRETQDLLGNLAGPEPLRGDRVIIRVHLDPNDVGRDSVEIVERDAIAARHVDDLVFTLTRTFQTSALRALKASLPEWVRDHERGLVVTADADDEQAGLCLYSWGEVRARALITFGPPARCQVLVSGEPLLLAEITALAESAAPRLGFGVPSEAVRDALQTLRLNGQSGWKNLPYPSADKADA